MILAKSKDGFVLAATLWILAAITLAASFFALWTQRAVERARQEQENLAAEIEISGTRAGLLYLLGTQRMTLAGITTPGNDKSYEDDKRAILLGIPADPVGGEIRLDDRIYSGLGEARFSIQDESGLLSLNDVNSLYLGNLLNFLGVPPEKKDSLIDKLRDYTDADELHRLNGAEAPDYQKAGRPPPPNRILLTSWEIRNVLGWENWPDLWEGYRLPRLTTTASLGMPSFNNAPELVLKSLKGIDDETAARIINARKKRPFGKFEDIFWAVGRRIPIANPLQITFLPSGYLRFTIWHKNFRRMREVHVNLIRAGAALPWRIDYEIKAPLPEELIDAPFQSLSILVFAPPASAKTQ